MAQAAPAGAPPRTDHHLTEPDRLVAMALEIGTMGPRLPAAVGRVVAEGRLAQLLDALEGGVADSAAAATVRARIATAAAVQQIVAREPIDFKLLERLVPLVGAAAAPPLLDALAAAESRGARRGLLAQLAKMGAEIAPFVIARLDDSRWYVTRNLLALLEELGPPPAGFSAAPYMRHTDARVRWQAVKLQLKRPAERDEALVVGLRDQDPRTLRLALGLAVAATTLYRPGHPAREGAIDDAHRELNDLQATESRPLFTFLGDEIVFGRLPLRELKAWDWGQRLALAGIQRLEFSDVVSREEFEQFLDEVLARLTLSAIDTTEARQMRRSSIRFGAVGVRGGDEQSGAAIPTATITYSLSEEADTVRWVQEEVQARGTLPLTEAEAVVRSLSIAMHGGRQIVIPLLQLKEFDQYTTTHSMNVAVLTMALAESRGLSARDVRSFGVAGLLHDIGKVKIPIEVLTKPGRFSDTERALMNRHPAEGARLILRAEEDLDLAAVVAYEHHIMLNGDGYPTFQFRRDCHEGSKLVHVCDVYDALRTNRPYREAWPQSKTLSYIEDRAGTEFDPELAGAFVRMMRQFEPQVAVLTDERAPVPGEPVDQPPPPPPG